MTYQGNSYYHNIFHIWDREKLNKLFFLDITKKIIELVGYELIITGYNKGDSDFIFNMEKEFILDKKHGIRELESMCNQLINETDFW